MSTEDNTARTRRLVKACYNSGNLTVTDEVLAPDFGHHDLSASHMYTLWRKKWSHMQLRPKSQA